MNHKVCHIVRSILILCLYERLRVPLNCSHVRRRKCLLIWSPSLVIAVRLYICIGIYSDGLRKYLLACRLPTLFFPTQLYAKIHAGTYTDILDNNKFYWIFLSIVMFENC